MSLQQKICWVVTEGMAGTENQCLAVAEALELEPVVKRISLRQPWKTLSPWLGFERSRTFSPALEPPWPDLLLTSGRKSIAASLYIKRASGGKTFTVQIQDPRISPAQFDLVAVPAHDPARGKNVVITAAAPNRITLEKLEQARKEHPGLANLPSPRVAVLIGGNSKAYTLSTAVMDKLIADLKQLDAGLMITASRRTGEDNARRLQNAFQGDRHIFWDGQRDNPYFGYLAWADYILVTSDSVSMLSDAASTGKPTYMIPLEGGGARLQEFHENLKQKGILRIFDGRLESWAYEPLDDAGIIARAIEKRIFKRESRK